MWACMYQKCLCVCVCVLEMGVCVIPLHSSASAASGSSLNSSSPSAGARWHRGCLRRRLLPPKASSFSSSLGSSSPAEHWDSSFTRFSVPQQSQLNGQTTAEERRGEIY